MVSPEQSERLTLASTEGKIQLALRNPLDAGTPETPGIRPGVLMGVAQPRPVPVPRPPAAEPAPPPPPPPTVEVIRGDKREQARVG
jgi:pilus assembly protein CpaB